MAGYGIPLRAGSRSPQGKLGPSLAETERVICPASRLSFWAPTSLTAAIASRWIGNGTADEICRTIQQECGT
ncbi:hypothetical protein BQ8482_290042 [Mesorhizobium delmotii]|uniref:Uncharacterized protein n=1 Tax=Mesorhizobium delmotii TaxID=1631247 RepID=A0A2P9AMS1_9HYPH|nr:hypothetical protein BQ8482_290042 [Mesorhizobium delmotii]